MQTDYIEVLKSQWNSKVNDEQEQIASQLQLYVPAMLGSTEAEPSDQRKEALSEIRQFLNSDDKLMLLLGDSGVGKTLFCQWLTTFLWGASRNTNTFGLPQWISNLFSGPQSPQEWIPIFIHLPAQSIKKGYLEKFLLKQCNLAKYDLDRLKREQKILLILDSFDEMKSENQKQNLFQLGELYQWQLKVIISCRSEALVTIKPSQQQLLFQPYQDHTTPLKLAWQRRFVQAFNAAQITPYITQWQRCNPDLANKDLDYLKIIKAIPNLADMISNPFILWAMMLALPKILNQYRHEIELEQLHLTRMALYDHFTTAWFERQRDKLYHNGLIDKLWSQTIVEDYQIYCQQLADILWQQRDFCVKYEYFPKANTQLVDTTSNAASSEHMKESIWDLFFAPGGNFNGIEGKPLKLIRQGALLRISSGNTYSFLHHSLLEFFSAKKLFSSAKNKAAIVLGLEINSQTLTNNPAMIRLGADFALQDKVFEDSLWEIIEESKHEPRVQIAAANAATILAAANKSFAGKDLRRIRIRGANVSGANFENADLGEADLRDVNVSQAWLSRTNLSGSCLDKIATGENHSESLENGILKCLYTRDGKHYVVMTKKSVIVYEAYTHKKLYSHSPNLDEKEILWAIAIGYANDTASIWLGTLHGFIIVLSFPECKEQRKWIGHNSIQNEHSSITAIAMSSNGQWALSASSDANIKRWNCMTGKCEAIWQGHKYYVTTLILNSDDNWALSGSKDTTIRLWDTQKGYCKAIFQGHTSPISALALSHDGKSAISGDWDNTIKCWDIETKTCLSTWQEHTNRISALLSSPDGQIVISASWDRTIKRWNPASGKCITTLRGHTWRINTLALSPDNRWLISGSENGELKCWDNDESMPCLATPHGHAYVTEKLVLSRDGKWALSIAADQMIKRWDIETGLCTGTWQRDFKGNAILLMSHNDSQVLSAGTESSVIKCWDIATNVCLTIDQEYQHRYVKTLVLNSDSRWALCGTSLVGSIKKLDCLTKTWVDTWEGHSSCVSILTLSRDDKWALSASNDGTIKRWDSDTGTCVTTWKHECTAKITHLVFSSDAKWALSGSQDYIIKRWNCVTGECLAVWQGSGTGELNSLILSQDDHWAISSGNDELVIIWQPLTGEIVQKYTFTYFITDIKWSTYDPSLIMMGMIDGSVSAWTFVPKTAALELRWRTHPWGFFARNSKLLGVYGLSESLQHNFIRENCAVQISTKPSLGVIAQRQSSVPYQANNPRTSLFNKNIVIREDAWAVSIVRKKVWNNKVEKNDPTKHAFMLLESVEEGYYQIRRIDFVLEHRHQQISQDSTTGISRDIFGQGLIEIADKSLFDMQSLVAQCCARPRGITKDDGIKLLKNIREDQKTRIGYCLMGSSSLYRIFRMKEAQEHHNCISWCEKHLRMIEITDITNQSWIQGIVENPLWLIPDEQNAEITQNLGGNNNNTEEPNSGNKCQLM